MQTLKFCNRSYHLALPILLILLLSLSGCFQQDADSKKSSTLHWIEDKSGTMTFDQIRDTDTSSTQWNLAKQENPNFGFTDSTYWLSLPFENTKDVPSPMLLEMAFSLHDSIDVYLLDGNNVVSTFHTGDQGTFSKRPLNHRNFLFPYTVPPKEKLRAVVRVKSTDTMYLPLKVWESNEFFTKDQHETLLLGIFFGFLSIMLVYNLILYFSTRRDHYLSYVWCTASIIYLQLTQKGMGYQYFWSEQVFFNHMSVPLSSFMVMVTSLFFISKFLDLNERQHAKTILAFKFFISLSLAGIIWVAVVLYTHISIIPYPALIISVAVIGATATVVVIGVLTQLSIKGDRSAQILLVAWLSFLTGVLLFALGRMGAPMPMMLCENAMLIGSTLEAALISFALASHIKSEREARMYAQVLALANERKSREAQNSLFILQQKTTHQLEEEVKERTKKLETAMHSLTVANHKLDNLSRIDGLTGLSNRRNFDQEFNEGWRICTELKQPMSLLMADIDHFKNINDTYGHLFGDQCLVKVAQILKDCVKQPEHLAARFGGEEFIIMLPGSNANEARLIAELIRESIEKLQLSSQGETVRFSISIGVSSIVPTPETSFVDLNESADQALYFAKENGRNQVILSDSSPTIAKERRRVLSGSV